MTDLLGAWRDRRHPTRQNRMIFEPVDHGANCRSYRLLGKLNHEGAGPSPVFWNIGNLQGQRECNIMLNSPETPCSASS
jgi:hypothetical protein